ncbi:hypothetical protein [Streptomyces niveus]|uniref:hypothetical protein n=1 Tax=Streptomyces niveus TaxID=193462 RepID=UPI003432CB0F
MGFTAREIEEAARTEAVCRRRLAEIEQEHTDATPERHQQLNRETGRVYGDLKRATFILTEQGEPS